MYNELSTCHLHVPHLLSTQRTKHARLIQLFRESTIFAQFKQIKANTH